MATICRKKIQSRYHPPEVQSYVRLTFRPVLRKFDIFRTSLPDRSGFKMIGPAKGLQKTSMKRDLGKANHTGGDLQNNVS